MKLNIQLFAYKKKEWKDLPSKDTPILAADLNNIENEIATNLSPDAYYGKTEIDNKENKLKAENEYLNSVIEQAFTPVEKEGTSINYDNTINARFKDIKLCGDTTQNGTPTPDTPVPVNVVTGDNTIDICGKNLLPNNVISGTRNGITWVVNNDGSILINGTATAQVNITIADGYYFPIDDTYIISGCPSGGTGNTYSIVIGYYDENKSWKAETYDTGSGKVLNQNYAYANVGILIRNGTTCNNLLFKPMIEKGSTATTYEPYQSQSYAVNLGTMELCKLGDYQDYIHKDNGKWYLEKQIGKVVLNGSENISSYAPTPLSGSYQATFDISTRANSTDKIVLSDYFTSALLSDRTTKTNICYTYTDGLLRIANNLATTMADFKTWLASNNVTVYYVLATTTTTEITDTTLLEQLDELAGAKTYAGETNIVATSDGLTIIPKTTALTK